MCVALGFFLFFFRSISYAQGRICQFFGGGSRLRPRRKPRLGARTALFQTSNAGRIIRLFVYTPERAPPVNGLLSRSEFDFD